MGFLADQMDDNLHAFISDFADGDDKSTLGASDRKHAELKEATEKADFANNMMSNFMGGTSKGFERVAQEQAQEDRMAVRQAQTAVAKAQGSKTPGGRRIPNMPWENNGNGKGKDNEPQMGA